MFTAEFETLNKYNMFSKLNGFLIGFRIKSAKTGETKEFIHVKSVESLSAKFFDEFVNNQTKIKVRIFYGMEASTR